MSDDDPFADPFADDGDAQGGDAERTVIRPNPGGRRPAPVADAGIAPAPRQQPDPRAPEPRRIREEDVAVIAEVGINPMVKAATTLLSLAIRLRNRAQHTDVDALRERAIAEVKQFEQSALEASQPARSIRIARYALCATIDDLVLNTPWGSQSSWSRQSMVGTFHNETSGGERFYELLEQMEKDPARNRDILELLYLCLSLGFEGRLRVEQRGPAGLSKLRDGLVRTIRAQRGDTDRDLSPHWRGVAAGHRPLSSYIPPWLVAVVTVALLCLTYVGFSYALNGSSDRLYGRLNTLPPISGVELARAAPPPPPPVFEPAQIQRVQGFLETEIAQGLVDVFEDANTITVRLRGKGMFRSASDQVKDKFLPILIRVGEALENETGKVIIAGHSDNVPIRSVRFPSNWHLSLARAESILRLLEQSLSDGRRLSAEGRAANEPIASNDTPEGREQNRRIEVILLKAG